MDSRNTLKLFYAENGSKNCLILEKKIEFEKWQKWPYCIGYNKGKWLILGRNLKSAKIVAKWTLETH